MGLEKSFRKPLTRLQVSMSTMPASTEASDFEELTVAEVPEKWLPEACVCRAWRLPPKRNSSVRCAVRVKADLEVIGKLICPKQPYHIPVELFPLSCYLRTNTSGLQLNHDPLRC